MKASEQYLLVELFIILYKVVLTYLLSLVLFIVLYNVALTF